MFDNENTQYLVVVNGEEQYSIWPAGRDLPDGWTSVGDPRLRQECLDHIESVWTDMRPKSVREALENSGSLIGQGNRMVLSQLVDADDLKAMSPEELRNMLATLDDDVIYGEDGNVIEPNTGNDPA
ncbi:MbtH family NRPS accessory protein [Streptomyces sp. CC210A]|uniref:MbtH family protein n=1 Tax=unclassified Streptomyces TaxID=2593676 RepID=UPI0009A0EDDD|nr:MbtH family NRPS accessory protein [Streptomyces sp. CC210A]